MHICRFPAVINFVEVAIAFCARLCPKDWCNNTSMANFSLSGSTRPRSRLHTHTHTHANRARRSIKLDTPVCVSSISCASNRYVSRLCGCVLWKIIDRDTRVYAIKKKALVRGGEVGGMFIIIIVRLKKIALVIKTISGRCVIYLKCRVFRYRITNISR